MDNTVTSSMTISFQRPTDLRKCAHTAGVLSSKCYDCCFLNKLNYDNYFQLSVIILLACILILELIKFSESYKPIKPYKFYNPWRPRRWQSFAKSSKHYRSKRILPQNHHIFEPDYERYAPIYEDSVDNTEEDKPYVIVIQLPRKKEKNKYQVYQRQHVIDAPQNIDYIDDNDDELKVYHINNKTVRIKVNDRLSVLTS
ncbi:hypothetical protein DMN91_005739 [Ooceraea biroi]|uniref:Uncharacterized protein n=1 Tax=Ooceraea biroi TaxID=2015173 RepID=A0A3L8DM14_OOCBI|nr:uncharacterized protein LOC113562207 [Ooceraea biroi]RLU21366.1 hypothetical protein DMN91_005739 [Ooceraea biroi]